ncbi:FAD:protein FMN transferase [Arenicella xantha]|uniref:FAD:protein FMN transferase n=1 Tax=Arenicella xantha TaxID=644221 RepID=A0A395JIA9_9GAMM|nr:FAD:protein FMN transferase [Arenicella xantha]RBP48336.1 thiamine biosynthesis lipoprotein [Arenicella xantha]
MSNRHTRLFKNSERCSLFLIVMLGLVLLGGCQPTATEVREWVFSGPIMGTQYRVVVIAPESLDASATEQVIMTAMESVNQAMSTYISGSELSQFNRQVADQPTSLSADLNSVVAEALEIAALTDGAFDPTIGPAVNLWGFGPQGRITRKPNESELDSLRQSIGYQKLSLNDSVLSKKVDGVTLDLSAIAKGFAVDKVAQSLAGKGLNRFLVDIGGELRASGAALSGDSWRIAIEKPQILGGVQQVIELRDQAIATSGDYRNFIQIDGQPFSHTISPETLKPVFHRLASVSVITQRASTGDALATALMSMGEERAMAFIEDHGLAAYLLIRKENSEELETYISDEFNTNLQ